MGWGEGPGRVSCLTEAALDRRTAPALEPVPPVLRSRSRSGRASAVGHGGSTAQHEHGGSKTAGCRYASGSMCGTYLYLPADRRPPLRPLTRPPRARAPACFPNRCVPPSGQRWWVSTAPPKEPIPQPAKLGTVFSGWDRQLRFQRTVPKAAIGRSVLGMDSCYANGCDRLVLGGGESRNNVWPRRLL